MVLRLLGKFWPSREADIAVVPEWREREGKHVLLASWVGLGEIQRRGKKSFSVARGTTGLEPLSAVC